MWHLEIATMTVIVGALGMIKKETDKCIDKIPGIPSLYETEKLPFGELLISLRKNYQGNLKISPKEALSPTPAKA